MWPWHYQMRRCNRLTPKSKSILISVIADSYNNLLVGMCGDGLIMLLHLTERREMLQLCDEGFHTVTIGNRSQVDFTLLAIHWVNICSEQTWKNECVNILWPSLNTHTLESEATVIRPVGLCVSWFSELILLYFCVSAQRINDIYKLKTTEKQLSMCRTINLSFCLAVFHSIFPSAVILVVHKSIHRSIILSLCWLLYASFCLSECYP